MIEEWRPVVRYEGRYEVSNHGRVRSLGWTRDNPLTGGTSFAKGRVLTPKTGKRYQSVMLYPGRKMENVHRLVCEAFHGPAPEGKPLALHRNDTPTDNRSSNLKWGSHRDNELDKSRNGNNPNANKTHCKRGHAFSPDNVYLHDRGTTVSRVCLACRRAYDARRRARKRGSGAA